MRFLQIIILIFVCWTPQYTGQPGDETQQHGTIVDASFDIDDLESAEADVRLARQASFHKDIDERRLISVNRAGKLPKHRRPGGRKKSVFRNRHGSQNINKEHRKHNPHAHRHRIQGTSGEGRGKLPPESSRFGPQKAKEEIIADNAQPTADVSETSTVPSTPKPHRTTLAGSTRSNRPNDADVIEPQPTFAPRLHPKFTGFNFTRFHGRVDMFGGNSQTTRFPETIGAQGISRSTMGRTRPPPTAPPRSITPPPQPPTMVADTVTQTPTTITRQPTRLTRPQLSSSLPSTIPSMTRPLPLHRSTVMMRSFTRRPPQRPPTMTSDSSTNSQIVPGTAETQSPSSFSPPISTRISSTAESERTPPILIAHTTVPVLSTRLETTPTTPSTPSDPTIPMRIFAPVSAPGFTLPPPQAPPRMTDATESITRTSTLATFSPSSSTTVFVTPDTVSDTARLPTVTQTPPTAPPAGVESNSIDEPAPPAPPAPPQQQSPPQLGAFPGFPTVPGAPGAIPPDDFVVNALNNADDFLEVARKLKLKRIVRRKRMAEIQRNIYRGN